MRKCIIKGYSHGLIFILLLIPLLLLSCKDVAPEHYYTFTGETVEDYLSNREETYSDFLTILKRAKLLDLMSTYGEYTCFAPTNTAIEEYLQAKDILSVDDLTDELCDTIAKNHLVQGAYYTVDLEDGVLPATNFLNRYLTFTTDSSIINNDIKIQYYINKSTRITTRDDSVENGVVHTVNQVITTNSSMLPDLIGIDSTVTIFYNALVATHLKDSLYQFIDPNYSCQLDSVEDGIYYHTGNEWEYAYYMEKRYIKYTAFVEPDSVFNRNNIYDLEDLQAYAKTIYDQTYPEDAGLYDDDLTNRKNPLNRFVAYHLLDRLANYNDLNVTGDVKTKMQVVDLLDATDYYETMCPNTTIKSSSPSVGIFLNRVGLKTAYTRRGVRVIPPTETSVDQSAVNGVYHYIDGILEYSEDARQTVFNTRFRLDATTLSPDFMSSGARGRAGTNSCTGFKVGSIKYWSFTPVTFVSVRNRHTDFDCYQGDEVVLLGQFDFTFKLPPVPDGTYEIRLGYCSLPSRGIVQMYFDDEPCGIPLDLRVGATDPKIGWVADTDDEQEDKAVDKAMHSRGYMKAPDSMCKDAWGSTHIFRTESNVFRRIITTKYLENDEPHYLRFKQVLESTTSEFAFDYIEICPKSIYAGAEGEDTH